VVRRDVKFSGNGTFRLTRMTPLRAFCFFGNSARLAEAATRGRSCPGWFRVSLIVTTRSRVTNQRCGVMGDFLPGSAPDAAAPPETDEKTEQIETQTTISMDPACYFLVHNIAKKHNVGTIARCATAFGVREVVLIGSKSYNAFGSKGADGHVRFCHYETLSLAAEKLKSDKGVTQILGVEIVDGAVPVDTHPFSGPTAFICGNEGDGLSDAQKAICDGFVYIKQHGPGTASLNVAVAASLVMHHFSLWANYPTRKRVGEKYLVEAQKPTRTHKRGMVGEDPETVRRRRAAKREEIARNEEEAEGQGNGDGGE
jgi:tRNA C32,U32 (ribose-2'-O)-methylase TrmJ